MKKALNNDFNKQGVEIADIMIQNIVLPPDIAQQMTNKTLVRSKQECVVAFGHVQVHESRRLATAAIAL